MTSWSRRDDSKESFRGHARLELEMEERLGIRRKTRIERNRFFLCYSTQNVTPWSHSDDSSESPE